MDLKASASYRKLALTAQDTCFTWSADPEVGTVDANGVFTAGTKSASGNLTVSAGGQDTHRAGEYRGPRQDAGGL